MTSWLIQRWCNIYTANIKMQGFLHRVSQVKIVKTTEHKQPMMVSFFGPHCFEGTIKNMEKMPVLKK